MAMCYNLFEALNYIVVAAFLIAVIGRSHLGGRKVYFGPQFEGKACWWGYEVAGHTMSAARKQEVRVHAQCFLL